MTRQLRILTYNIHKGYCSGNRRFVLEGMRALIAETGADLVFLQEIHGRHSGRARHEGRYTYPDRPHFEYLADQSWPHYAYGRNAIYRKGDHGNAILSKFPFVRWENINVALFPRSSRSILHGVIEIPESGFRLHTLCVHLGLLEQERRGQLEILAERIESHVPHNEPLIIAGDFNTFWGTHEIYLFMRAAKLRSANTHGLPSFPSRTPRIELDFVLVSESIEVTDFRVPDVRFSDHRPVICDFNVVRSAAAADSHQSAA